MQAQEPIRVLVVDDHPLFREGVRAMLAATTDTDLIGEAATGEEAIALALTLQPDVILMDLQLPDLPGVEVTRRILHTSPRIGVIVVTMFDDDDSIFAAMRVGAHGYIVKGADKAEMLRAVRAVANDEALFSPAIARRLMTYFTRLGATSAGQVFPELTEREREVLTLIARGLNNQQIAERLVLSGKTVRNHIGNIFSKLQVADRAQAIVRAQEAGLGKR